MTRILLTILILGGVAGGVPFVLLRKAGGLGRSIFAYAMGFLVSSSTSVGVFLTTQAILPAPVLDTDRIIGSGLFCAVIGPILGVLAAKRFRPPPQPPDQRPSSWRIRISEWWAVQGLNL